MASSKTARKAPLLTPDDNNNGDGSAAAPAAVAAAAGANFDGDAAGTTDVGWKESMTLRYNQQCTK
jgi:hypothetical protein